MPNKIHFMRRIIILLTILTLVGFSLYFFVFLQKSEEYTDNSAFKCVALRMPIIIEIPNISDFLASFDNNDEIISQIKNINGSNIIFDKLNSISTFIKENKKNIKDLDDKSILIAFANEPKVGVEPLYSFSIENRLEQDAINDLIDDYSKKNNYNIGSFNYDGTIIKNISFPNADKLHFTTSHGVFIASQNRLLVEEAIRQIGSNSLTNNDSFNELYSTVSNSSTFNIFINHGQISSIINKFIKDDFIKTTDNISSFAQWSEYDLNYKKNNFWLNGYSILNTNNDSYLSSLNGQNPQRFSISELISSNSAMFININLSSFEKFIKNYQEHLKLFSDKYYLREARLLELNKLFNKDILQTSIKISDNDFALVYGSIIQNSPTSNRFFISKIKSKSIAEEELTPILNSYAISLNKTVDQIKQSYSISAKKTFDIYKFPISDYASLIFGKAFSSVECNYMCLYNNYIIFSESESSLQNYIHDLELSSTLKNSDEFKYFNKEMNSSSNIYLYINTSRFLNINTHYLNEHASKVISDNENFLRKIQSIGWQISNENSKALNSIHIAYNPNKKEEPQALWQTKLDSTINFCPQFVVNHTDLNNKEIFVQDAANNIYLINNKGAQVWKIKLSDKILGKVHQIDIFGNKRYQLVFNTREKLYILDRNGNNVGKFPITFKSPATNGVSVFDYANNSNYRLFVACEDKNTYPYDKNGNIVTGWVANSTDSEVTNTIQYHIINDKDHIIFCDKYNNYAVNRRGEVRLSKSEKFEHSNNDIYLITNNKQKAIATTDVDGIVHIQYFSGESKTIKIGKFTKNHLFISADIDNDGEDDFIFTQEKQLVAYTSKGKKIFDRKFKANIEYTPSVHKLNNSTVIGICCPNENLIYFVDSKGNNHPGTPLYGCTMFSVDNMNKSSNYKNIIVGDKTGNLLNYSIE